jgi:hypothetical protein
MPSPTTKCHRADGDGAGDTRARLGRSPASAAILVGRRGARIGCRASGGLGRKLILGAIRRSRLIGAADCEKASERAKNDKNSRGAKCFHGSILHSVQVSQPRW